MFTYKITLCLPWDLRNCLVFSTLWMYIQYILTIYFDSLVLRRQEDPHCYWHDTNNCNIYASGKSQLIWCTEINIRQTYHPVSMADVLSYGIPMVRKGAWVGSGSFPVRRLSQTIVIQSASHFLEVSFHWVKISFYGLQHFHNVRLPIVLRWLGGSYCIPQTHLSQLLSTISASLWIMSVFTGVAVRNIRINSRHVVCYTWIEYFGSDEGLNN